MRMAEEKKVTKLALNAHSSTKAIRRNYAASFAVGPKRLHLLTGKVGRPSLPSTWKILQPLRGLPLATFAPRMANPRRTAQHHLTLHSIE